MRTFKKLGVVVAVFALSAIGAASASAAQFTASAVGNLTGSATQTQVLTTTAGQIKCTVAESSGEIKSTASTEQHVTVNYKNCTAFGFANVHISPATYNFTANGTAHIKNTITINTTLNCHITIHPQNRGGVSYINESNGHVRVTPHIFEIHWTTTPAHGSICGTTGTSGNFTGDSTLTRVGGGTVSFHP